MTFKIRLIAAGLAASLLAAASIAAAQTGAQATQGANQQPFDSQLITRMADHCNRVVGRISQ